jgi:integrase/recombinase XerC
MTIDGEEQAPMPHLSPQTLTQAEQRALLRATASNPRDHLIYSLWLGTGLRLAEIVGLDVGDVYTADGKPKDRVRLRPEIAKNGRAGDAFLPDALLAKFGGSGGTRPRGTRGSDRRIPSSALRAALASLPAASSSRFRTWQVKAGFDRLYPFHSLRHSAITAVYLSSGDLFLAQRFARHMSPLTTTVIPIPRTKNSSGGSAR